MVGVAAVAHVQPGDVHPGVDQLADLLRVRDGGTEGADDLGSSHADHPSEVWNVPSNTVTPRAVAPSAGSGPAAPSSPSGTRRRRPRRPGPRRSPRRSATGRDRSRRPRRRRRRSAPYVASRRTLPRSSSSQPSCSTRPAVCGPVKPIASSTRSAGISRSVPGDLDGAAALEHHVDQPQRADAAVLVAEELLRRHGVHPVAGLLVGRGDPEDHRVRRPRLARRAGRREVRAGSPAG